MTVTTLNHLKNPEELLESAFEAGEPLYVFDGAKTVLVVATPNVYNDMLKNPQDYAPIEIPVNPENGFMEVPDNFQDNLDLIGEEGYTENP